MQTYIIRFNGKRIGLFTLQNSDFPNAFGRFQRQPCSNAKLESQLDAYIAFWLQAEKIEQENGFGDAWDEYISDHEDAHQELMENGTWSAEQENGQEFAITAPVFHQNDTMSFVF